MFTAKGRSTKDYICLSTDIKPTKGVANGALCLEMDTGKIYAFNESDSEWEEVASTGGGGGGGGNHNTVQTVTGTLASTFGDIDVSTLSAALESMDASAYFEADASALGEGTVTARLGGDGDYIWGNGAEFDFTNVIAFGLKWDSTGTLTFAKMLNQGNVVDISTYASAIPTTLTIVWHPLP